MVHIGSIVAAGCARGSSKKLGITTAFDDFNNDHARRNFVSIGTAAGVAARRAESARFSARSWRDRASGVVAMGDGASMSAGSSPTTGAAASRRRCAWRLAFFA